MANARENAMRARRRMRGRTASTVKTTTTTVKTTTEGCGGGGDDGAGDEAGVVVKPRRLCRRDDDDDDDDDDAHYDDDGRRKDTACHASRVRDRDGDEAGVDVDAEETTVETTEAMSAMMMLRLDRDASGVRTGGDARGETRARGETKRVDRGKTREASDAYASDTAMLDHALRAEDSFVEASNAAYETRVKGRRAMRAVALDVAVQTAEALRRDAATLTGESSARSVGAQADELDDSAREEDHDVEETKSVSMLRVATGRRRSDVDGVSALGVVEAILRERERAEYGLKYRGVRPVDDDDDGDAGENALTCLVTLRSETLVGLNISALQFNPKRKDLLCVAYGEFNFERAVSEEFNRGALAFWSLQSDAPLRIVRLESGVLSIDWSTSHPNLLVVGCYDGEVLVFNLDDWSSIRRRRVHHDPVWAVKWFDHASSAADVGTSDIMTVDSTPRLCDTFLSASTDGFVIAWELRDDLQSKRAFSLRWSPPGQPSQADVSAVRDVQTGEELVRRGGITCVDVSKSAASDSNSKSYLIGTEEGKIYECSLSRLDQWMKAYDPHIAPVYSLKINPHCPNVFATCSADWSVKIFHDEKLSDGGGRNASSSIAIDGVSSSNVKESLVLAEYVLERGCEPINDLDWSPWRSTELAIVTDDGKLEIWDLASSIVVPLHELHVGGKDGTAAVSVMYSRESPVVIVVGLANGTVTVLRTRWRRVTDTFPTAEKHRERIESVCRRRTQYSS